MKNWCLSIWSFVSNRGSVISQRRRTRGLFFSPHCDHVCSREKLNWLPFVTKKGFLWNPGPRSGPLRSVDNVLRFMGDIGSHLNKQGGQGVQVRRCWDRSKRTGRLSQHHTGSVFTPIQRSQEWGKTCCTLLGYSWRTALSPRGTLLSAAISSSNPVATKKNPRCAH